ncbi:hypothetical protein [uncultured Rikenella sp.]|uniref:hypothetical protein n=1 Tax=uncultured Rikenella sp. TaxID=368003 RepID=UPI00261F11B2|nr:hypothetical protein [uncultured Rikenella sp.]
MDNNLLKQLIAQHRRVVIPDFGAFLKKEGPRGEQLVFSPFLRKDDGMVTEALIREYGVESEDARGMIAEFVVYVRQSLSSSGRYYIEGVGMLAADANGSITLKEGVMPERSRAEVESERMARQAPPQPQPVMEQIVEAEPVPVQPVMTKPPVMTRPQTIQVQPPMGQPGQLQGQQQPASLFGTYPGIQQQPMRQQQPQMPQIPPQQSMRTQPVAPQHQQVMGQQPVQQPIQPGQRPQHQQAMGQQPIQPGQRPIQPGQRPHPSMQPQQGVRGGQQSGQPMQPQQGQQQQAAMGQPMQQQAGMIPPSQRQPQQPGQQGRPGGAAQGAGRPTRPGQGASRPGQPYPGGRRPPVRRRPQQRTKADVWLIVAIIAALVVIAIMIYSFIVSGGGQDMDMEMLNEAMAPMQDASSSAGGDGL